MCFPNSAHDTADNSSNPLLSSVFFLLQKCCGKLTKVQRCTNQFETTLSPTKKNKKQKKTGGNQFDALTRPCTFF